MQKVRLSSGHELIVGSVPVEVGEPDELLLICGQGRLTIPDTTLSDLAAALLGLLRHLEREELEMGR
jgi:hypothetical protein